MERESAIKKLGLRRSLLPLVVLLAEIAVFEARDPRFLYEPSLVAIGDQLALILPLALAGTFIIIMGSFDLSITSILALTGITVAIYFPTLGYLAIPLAIAVGATLGLVNGLIFIFANIPSFIVTIGTMVTFNGIALIVMKGGQSIQIYTSSLRDVAILKVGGVDLMIFWAFAIFLVSYFTLARTKFGRQTQAIGANIEAAKRAAINIRKQRVLNFMISGTLSGIVGVLFVAYSSQASANIGSNLLLPAVAAMVLGGNPITGGVGGAHRTLLGAIILATLSNGLIVLAVPINLQTIIYGIVVIVTIAATTDRERVRFIR